MFTWSHNYLNPSSDYASIMDGVTGFEDFFEILGEGVYEVLKNNMPSSEDKPLSGFVAGTYGKLSSPVISSGDDISDISDGSSILEKYVAASRLGSSSFSTGSRTELETLCDEFLENAIHGFNYGLFFSKRKLSERVDVTKELLGFDDFYVHMKANFWRDANLFALLGLQAFATDKDALYTEMMDELSCFLDEKNPEMVDLAPGSKGVKTYNFTGAYNTGYNDIFVQKEVPVEHKADLESEFALSRTLCEYLASSKTILTHSMPVNLKVEDGKAVMKLKRVDSITLGEFASRSVGVNIHKDVYSAFAKDITFLQHILETKSGFDFSPIDYEKKLVSAHEHLTGESVNRSQRTILKDIVNMLSDYGGEQRPVLDYHHNNLGVVPVFVLEEDARWGCKYDTEYKGAAPEILEYVNLVHHSFDVIPESSYSEVDDAVFRNFGTYLFISDSGLKLAKMAGIYARTLSFLKAWSDPERTEEHARIKPFLKHTIQCYASETDSLDVRYRPVFNEARKQLENLYEHF